MTEEKDTPKMELTEVMLAMDVVDTLRHRQSLAERELSADDHDQALIERVRRIYADQGLEVSDAVIAQGVAALREERFVYKPPRKNFRTLLARMYVRRGLWTKLGGLAIVLLLGVWLVYQFMFAGPAERQRNRQTKQLESVWQQFQAAKFPAEINKVGDRLYRQAKQGIEAGKTDTAASAVSGLETLVELPAGLSALNATVQKEARDPAAKTKAQNLYRDGIAALGQGDLASAQKTARALSSLSDRIKMEYSLQIVSRPDVRSGLWRQSEANRNTRNYYIIVEAVTPDGKRLKMPITSEEDGKTRVVDTWGMRVDERVYEQIRRDKMDNGILDKNRFGTKKRGYLAPEYFYLTTGGAITQW
jgi:Family of unknown function (DUF6384)